MKPREINPGDRFNKLVVIEEVLPRSRPRRIHVRCDCGRKKVVALSHLTTGHTKSCGCEKGSSRVPSPIGERFGFLTVIEDQSDYVDEAGRIARVVRVQCVCGIIKDARLAGLRRGRPKSCGCKTRTRRKLIPQGTRFDRLVVIGEGPPSSRGKRRMRTQCDCGRQKLVSLSDLTTAHTTSCGCKPKSTPSPAPIGKKFGSLTVLAEVDARISGNGRMRRRMLVECDAGHRKVVNLDWLYREIGCGRCYHAQSRGNVVPGAAGRARVIAKYKWSARRRRGIEWSLTDEEFFDLIDAPCSYCSSHEGNFARDNVGDGGFHYTGIDRVDSSLGYSVANAVPCCWNCNNAKRNQSIEDFQEWIERIGRHLESGGWELRRERMSPYSDDQQFFGAHDPARRNKQPPELTARNNAFGLHRIDAANRKLESSLTREEWTRLVACPCHYCGKAWSRVAKNGTGAEFRLNGLDRIDPSSGYVIENVIPCCKQCNYAKRDLRLDEFEAWIRRLTQTRQRRRRDDH